VPLLRRVIFWCHLCAGVVAGTIVLIMSVTGLLLTYERQILSRADTRAYRSGPDSTSASRLAPSTMLAAVQSSNPSARVTGLTLWADPRSPGSVLVGQRTVYVSPYTAQVLGDASPQPRAFFRRVTDWHRRLGITGKGRATARMITGACNLAFLFLVVSGFYLWFPRYWSWRQVRAVAWFRGGLRGKARDFNWHNTIGLWSAVPLFIVVLSGVVISYPWASNLVYRAVGETPPPRAPAAAPGVGGPGGGPGGSAVSGEREGAGYRRGGGGRADGVAVTAARCFDDVNALWARAEQQVHGWKSIAMRLPSGPAGPVTFTIDEGDGGQPQKRSTLMLDGRTGEIVHWEPFASLSAGRRLRSYLRFAHTGEVLGLFGQTAAGLASAGAAVLVWTGLALAWRRLPAWRQRRSAALVATRIELQESKRSRDQPATFPETAATAERRRR
jgi:uncharacterized iron-regulated membrane protein